MYVSQVGIDDILLFVSCLWNSTHVYYSHACQLCLELQLVSTDDVYFFMHLHLCLTLSPLHIT